MADGQHLIGPRQPINERRPPNEERWLAARYPGEMLTCVRHKAWNRKLTLLASGVARLVWDQLVDDQASRNAIEAAEGFADGIVTSEQLKAARKAVHKTLSPEAPDARFLAETCAHANGAWTTAYSTVACAKDRGLVQEPVLKALLVDVFRNPFRPLPEVQSVSEGVRRLANAIYAERAFDRLPILADALEEAGCTDEAILAHCRGPGPHVRGCWVVDLLLGKE